MIMSMMAEQQYISKKQEVLDKFNFEFVKKHYKTDPTLHGIVELLVREVSPYEIIQRLIEDRIKMAENFKEYMLYHGQPRLVNQF